MAAAYDRALTELSALRSAHWNDQMETVRLTALTEQVTAQVAGLRHELVAVRQELHAARSVPPVVVEVPSGGWSAVVQPSWAPQAYVHPDHLVAEAPAAPSAAAASSMREDLLLQEMAELRRLVAHQQTVLGDLTTRLLDLLGRFVPAPAAQPSYGAPPQPYPAAPDRPGAAPAPGPTATPYQAPDDLVMDDETASRLRVIREAFGR